VVRIIRITAPWILLLSCTCSLAWSQGAPLGVDTFAEGGGSFIRNTEYKYLICQQIGTKLGSQPCPPPETFNYAGRLFFGGRFRTGHNAFEASYSYSNNPAGLYNRQDLYSFNYVRYLPLKPKVQPFVTVGLGRSRFSGRSDPPSSFKLVWNYGGGGDIALRWHLALRLELRDYVGGQPAMFTGLSHTVVPSAGLVFRLSELIPRVH
jgi:hypothetical protein